MDWEGKRPKLSQHELIGCWKQEFIDPSSGSYHSQRFKANLSQSKPFFVCLKRFINDGALKAVCNFLTSTINIWILKSEMIWGMRWEELRRVGPCTQPGEPQSKSVSRSAFGCAVAAVRWVDGKPAPVAEAANQRTMMDVWPTWTQLPKPVSLVGV